MLGKALRILGSCSGSIQGVPIALTNPPPDTSNRSESDLQQAQRSARTDPPA